MVDNATRGKSVNSISAMFRFQDALPPCKKISVFSPKKIFSRL